MLVVLGAKSQITIPTPVMSSLGLKEGDQLELVTNNGIISMIPVTVYPSEYVQKLQVEVQQATDDIKSGKRPVFDSIDAMIDALEKS